MINSNQTGPVNPAPTFASLLGRQPYQHPVHRLANGAGGMGGAIGGFSQQPMQSQPAIMNIPNMLNQRGQRTNQRYEGSRWPGLQDALSRQKFGNSFGGPGKSGSGLI